MVEKQQPQPHPTRRHKDLDSVFAECNGKDVALVRDNDIFYLVLGKSDNVVSSTMIADVHARLTEVEESEGAAVLITLSSQEGGAFCSGFDPAELREGARARFKLALQFQRLLARVLTLPLPSFCVISGNTTSAGYFFALAHDFRIMKESKATIGITDLRLGATIPPAYGAMLRNLLTPEAVRLLVYGGLYKAT